MKILFTGNRGNLGKELIPLLEEDHLVQCYDIDYSNFDNVNSFFRHREIDFIIHAAIRGGRRVRADIADDFYNNMAMFENLAAQNIPMINICSGASYGRQDNIFKVWIGKLVNRMFRRHEKRYLISTFFIWCIGNYRCSHCYTHSFRIPSKDIVCNSSKSSPCSLIVIIFYRSSCDYY